LLIPCKNVGTSTKRITKDQENVQINQINGVVIAHNICFLRDVIDSVNSTYHSIFLHLSSLDTGLEIILSKFISALFSLACFIRFRKFSEKILSFFTNTSYK
jgi:tryptophan-rich sensory protein